MGGEVLLTWVTPTDTTDGDKVRGQITGAVCRDDSAQAGKAAACNVVQRFAVSPGPGAAADTLPPRLSTGAPTLLRYRVELLNDRGRSAGPSDPVYAAAGEAPAPVGPLRISPRREAALVQWRAQPSGAVVLASMELSRTLTATAAGPMPSKGNPGAASVQAPRQPAGALKTQGPKPFSAGKAAAGEVTLTDETAGRNGDAGGMLDRTVRDGNSYVYVAQRVRAVMLVGHQLELRGVASPPATFVYQDTSAPRAPTGLVAVPGGGFGAAPSVDLSWEPNQEEDLLGYNVYRREGSGAFGRLNPEPVPISAFRDLRVEPGHGYGYRVTAVDVRHNESAPSGEIHESLRQ